MLRQIIGDLRDAVRALGHQPRFAIVGALTLALGIGAVTSIFSVVNGVLLRPLPHPEPDRLVNVWSTAPGLGYDQFPVSPDLYFFYRSNNDVFDDIAIFQPRRSNLTDGATPEVVNTVRASFSYFSTLGAAFSMGRPFTAEEDLPDAPLVAVISHRFWTRQRGSDASIVGQQIRLNGEPHQIVGVAPAWLDAPESADVWLPVRFDPENPPVGSFGWNVVARLKTGATPEQAAAHLEPMAARTMETTQNSNYQAFLTTGQYRPLVHLMKEDIIGDVRQPLWILLGTVGMVLLIACANVANLFLIRAEGRQRETAIRVALGGGRVGLIRRWMTEALVLSAIGSGLGVLVSATALPALLRQAPASIPRLDRVGLDATVMLFAVAAAVISALLFGLVPALRYTRPEAIASARRAAAVSPLESMRAD